MIAKKMRGTVRGRKGSSHWEADEASALDKHIPSINSFTCISLSDNDELRVGLIMSWHA